jgi:hypothetical protein
MSKKPEINYTKPVFKEKVITSIIVISALIGYIIIGFNYSIPLGDN